ncbi:MAG: outer membrane beta-barrel protein [Pseudomonadota bacterium]|uniref:Outer membrane beta-barrel protein n=1 Tax=Caldimonas aquatica TaxID=376175 RepID=A0ABY6MV27_9BURK|nr:outer membrane beta-barrel protein [Schlegelella aquatica]UZD55872.1 outer membrane beta-barrel protein [Schlegelella aquatica]
MKRFRPMWRTLALAACTAAAFGAHAQQGSGMRAGGTSWIPYTTNGYFGVNVGQSDYGGPCTPGFDCDRRDWAGKIYVGGMFSPYFGVEVGYAYLGESDRHGGSLRAQGLNLSLVGNVPVGQAVDVFGKVGTTYGWTDSSAAFGTGVRTGSENEFGLSYGAGVAFNITRNWAAVLEWDRTRYRFADGRENVDMYSAGVRYRF